MDMYCPLCNDWHQASDYLSLVFSDEATRWVANMVTHYRHHHRKWDNQYTYLLRNYGEIAYENAKKKINEQAKRQIVRKCTDFLLAHGVGTQCFGALQGTTEETMVLVRKRLTPIPPVENRRVH